MSLPPSWRLTTIETWQGNLSKRLRSKPLRNKLMDHSDETNSVSVAQDVPGTETARRVRIVNKKGLHARASAKFVKCAGQFDADVEVSREGTTVNGTSIMGLMMLAASIGSEIEIKAKGPDASQALDSLEALINAKFDED